MQVSIGHGFFQQSNFIQVSLKKTKNMNQNKDLPIDPPGTILLEEFIKPMGLTQKAVAQATGIPYVRFNELINGKRRITAEYSLRLGRYFGQHESFWLNLQTDTDLRQAKAHKVCTHSTPSRAS